MPVDLSAVGKQLAPTTFTYGEKDVMLYALGVGAGTDELPFTYERDLKVLPTFGVIPAFPALFAMGNVMQVNPMMVLHGEQRIELFAPIPTRGTLTSTPTIKGIYDKIKGALIVVDADTVDAKGTLLFRNTFSTFARGEGGFGGDRGPSGPKNVPPQRPPDAVVEMKTLPQQALIYRLSGDMNPLHADPDFAKMGGYDRPILHGLCTFGHVGRAVLQTYCGNDPAKFQAFDVRFSGVVFPGETIVTEMWKENATTIIVQARTKERGEVAISAAAATVVG
ncbi:MAG: MaoC family dehydratase N-terminal domain-containing protein [Deltaproteobacteria bacterium]|nr:MaoC family dehydratase N-terminal domain-containing protein [Deltaproteobacteria bacterium]MBI3388880.1 MaoC family dehydratase N-terminal domain-containing protein [Deltaproteobacteria bacterium]